MENLGKKAKDKVTGFEGIITSKVSYLTGCDQYGVTPAILNGKIEDTNYFDAKRLEILEQVINPQEVTDENDKGGINRDCPKN